MFRLNHPNAKGRALPPKPSSVMTTSPVLALVLVKRQDQATHGGTSAGGGGVRVTAVRVPLGDLHRSTALVLTTPLSFSLTVAS